MARIKGKSVSSSKQLAGGQSILRASMLLSIVAESREHGSRLMDIAARANLHIATARRILQVLAHEGFIAFDAHKKIYTIGPAIFSYAMLGNPWFYRMQTFRPALEGIAKLTGDTVLFSVRSGNETVCLARNEGNHPVRVMTLNAGDRRPLGAGSGSLAILAFLPDEERQALIASNQGLYAAFGLTADDVRSMSEKTRRDGYSLNPGKIVKGIYGVGVPILSESVAVASVSVASIADRLDKVRRKEVVQIVRSALARIPGIGLPEIRPENHVPDRLPLASSSQMA